MTSSSERTTSRAWDSSFRAVTVRVNVMLTDMAEAYEAARSATVAVGHPGRSLHSGDGLPSAYLVSYVATGCVR
ncbi:hypothetical protein GCM10010393_12090 [Streptomyces gobitricini]|uniref:Uncharacterized protein n=1 Tax=Streptomyces gobitricini TaxID=68211 RepID=A0ABN3LIC4_9ACTN